MTTKLTQAEIKAGNEAFNKWASNLGKLARGRPKNYSQAERKRRAVRLAEVRQRRWKRRIES